MKGVKRWETCHECDPPVLFVIEHPEEPEQRCPRCGDVLDHAPDKDEPNHS